MRRVCLLGDAEPVGCEGVVPKQLTYRLGVCRGDKLAWGGRGAEESRKEVMTVDRQ